MANLLQYHNEENQGPWDPPYGCGQCGIVTKNRHHYTEPDVRGHTCWLVVGRKAQDGHLFYLGSRFTIEKFYENNALLPDYTHQALGQGETFLIALEGAWFEELYRKPKLYCFGFRFMSDENLAQHFERVVEEEHRRQRRFTLHFESTDPGKLDSAIGQIVQILIDNHANLLGPLPLPTRVERYKVLRDGGAREYQVFTHKRTLTIIDAENGLIQRVGAIPLPPGVELLARERIRPASVSKWG